MLRVITLNLNGVRSAAAKGWFSWLARQHPDIVCLQELKAHEADIAAAVRGPRSLIGHFHCAEKKGYSGVGLYSRARPDRVQCGLGIAEFDLEGRYHPAAPGPVDAEP